MAVLLELPVAGAGRRGVPSILPAGAEAELVPPESGRVRRPGPGLEDVTCRGGGAPCGSGCAAYGCHHNGEVIPTQGVQQGCLEEAMSDCIALYCTTLHFNTLHCTTLHYTAL